MPRPVNAAVTAFAAFGPQIFWAVDTVAAAAWANVVSGRKENCDSRMIVSACFAPSALRMS